MPEHRDLSDGEWRLVEPLIPKPERREDGRGRPWKPGRDVLNGILYVLRTRAAWAALPESYPPYQTCHRRFQQWIRTGVLQNVIAALGEDMLLWHRFRTERCEPSEAHDAPVSVEIFSDRVA